jgi:hypothetical protein
LIVLKRIAVHKEGAFGVLLSDGIPFCVTLERTYDEGHKVVKIPPGRYHCTRSRYHRGGYSTFEITVPGHSRILFHKGNTEDHSDGCVLLGEQFGVLNGKPAILQSGAAFAEFMAKTSNVDAFELHVVYCP